MKDRTYFTLRELTEQIFIIREWVLIFKNPYSEKHKEAVNYYNKLCRERDLLEEKIFGK